MVRVPPMKSRPLKSRWWFQLTFVAAVGFAIRVGYILAFENPYLPAADALYYFSGGQYWPMVTGSSTGLPLA